MEIKSAEEILDNNLQTIADNYDMSQDEFNIVIRTMKEYATQFIKESAIIADQWENSGQLGETIIKELRKQLK